MLEMALSRARPCPLHCSVDNNANDSCFCIDESNGDGHFDNDVSNTLYGVMQEGRKAISSESIVGGGLQTLQVSGINYLLVFSIAQG